MNITNMGCNVDLPPCGAPWATSPTAKRSTIPACFYSATYSAFASVRLEVLQWNAGALSQSKKVQIQQSIRVCLPSDLWPRLPCRPSASLRHFYRTFLPTMRFWRSNGKGPPAPMCGFQGRTEV
ncbi:hypothetical protein AVEN_118033-1 [Araneus ventricosus]|uniref:Uncharacterized protein n=1 Tax=Araneus ventricosus TaxID=182803 RepID=A0A4Y2C8C3_ARAVE|nr:hypothetical protein AVEN_118033-1 [Araneus ventricosus]